MIPPKNDRDLGLAPSLILTANLKNQLFLTLTPTGFVAFPGSLGWWYFTVGQILKTRSAAVIAGPRYPRENRTFEFAYACSTKAFPGVNTLLDVSTIRIPKVLASGPCIKTIDISG